MFRPLEEIGFLADIRTRRFEALDARAVARRQLKQFQSSKEDALEMIEANPLSPRGYLFAALDAKDMDAIKRLTTGLKIVKDERGFNAMDYLLTTLLVGQ
jgi:hypothetical protein